MADLRVAICNSAQILHKLRIFFRNRTCIFLWVLWYIRNLVFRQVYDNPRWLLKTRPQNLSKSYFSRGWKLGGLVKKWFKIDQNFSKIHENHLFVNWKHLWPLDHVATRPKCIVIMLGVFFMFCGEFGWLLPWNWWYFHENSLCKSCKTNQLVNFRICSEENLTLVTDYAKGLT